MSVDSPFCFLQRNDSTNSSQLKTWWHFLLSSHRFLWTLLNSRWRMRKSLCIRVQLEPAEKQGCPQLCISRQLHRVLLQPPGLVFAQCKHVPYQSRARVKQRFAHSVLHWFFAPFWALCSQQQRPYQQPTFTALPVTLHADSVKGKAGPCSRVKSSFYSIIRYK